MTRRNNYWGILSNWKNHGMNSSVFHSLNNSVDESTATNTTPVITHPIMSITMSQLLIRLCTIATEVGHYTLQLKASSGVEVGIWRDWIRELIKSNVYLLYTFISSMQSKLYNSGDAVMGWSYCDMEYVAHPDIISIYVDIVQYTEYWLMQYKGTYQELYNTVYLLPLSNVRDTCLSEVRNKLVPTNSNASAKDIIQQSVKTLQKEINLLKKKYHTVSNHCSKNITNILVKPGSVYWG